MDLFDDFPGINEDVKIDDGSELATSISPSSKRCGTWPQTQQLNAMDYIRSIVTTPAAGQKSSCGSEFIGKEILARGVTPENHEGNLPQGEVMAVQKSPQPAQGSTVPASVLAALGVLESYIEDEEDRLLSRLGKPESKQESSSEAVSTTRNTRPFEDENPFIDDLLAVPAHQTPWKLSFTKAMEEEEEDKKPAALPRKRGFYETNNPPCLDKAIQELEERTSSPEAPSAAASLPPGPLQSSDPVLNGSSGPQQPVSVPQGIDTAGALHRACQLFPKNKRMVEASLRLDPSAIKRKAFVESVPSQTRKYQDAIQKQFPRRKPKVPSSAPEPFQLPINIALYHNASLEVLDFLVQTDPSQLLVKDGIHGINSLCLALDRRPNDVACLGLLLVSNPESIKLVCDMYENTPLHVACQKGASLRVIKQLVQIHPAALLHRNAGGMLPMDVLKDLPSSSSEALDFLTERTNHYRQRLGHRALGDDMTVSETANAAEV